MNASAGNRTRVNCLEGSYAHHYTTDALDSNSVFLSRFKSNLVLSFYIHQEPSEREQSVIITKTFFVCQP